MSQPDNSAVVRAIIDMTLQVGSPLHVGTGERAPLIERVPTERKELLKEISSGDQSPSYRPMAMRRCELKEPGKTLEVDRAYIPGSTLKGAFRAMLETEPQADEIFGLSDKDGQGTVARQIGRVRFNDAPVVEVPEFEDRKPPLWCENRATAIRARVAIDPVTGATAPHQLTFFEFVPEGSLVSVRFDASNISRSCLFALAKALARMTSRGFRLGAGASLCAGELRLASPNDLSIKILDREKFKTFLGADDASSIENCYTELEFDRNTVPDKHDQAESNSIELSVLTLDPLLVASGLDRAEKDEQTGQKTEEYPDRLTVLQTPDGRVRIPASTLRGALRARARKILILWIQEFWKRRPNQEHVENTAARSATAILEAGKQADRLLENLFGSTTWASIVQISDFVSTKAIKTQDLHHQYFNAIDRFTGGVAEGALYEARAIPIGTELKGQLRLALRAETSIPPWTRLLLGLVLRDMAMGDIAIGWGKAKGYGTIKLRLKAESKIATLVGFQPEEGDDWLATAIRSELTHGPIAEQPPVDEQEVLTND